MEKDDTLKTPHKILKEKIVRVEGKDERLYLVKFKKSSSDQDLWFPEKDIENSSKLLREFRSSKRAKNL